MLGGDPDPAVPVFASHEVGVLVEFVSEKERPLDVNARAGKGVSLSQRATHTARGTNKGLVNRGPKLIDDPEQLKEEAAVGIRLGKCCCTVKRTRRQFVVRVEENQELATRMFSAPVARVGPLAIGVIDKHVQV